MENKVLDRSICICHYPGMIEQLTAADIEAKALDARVSLTAVLEKAGVSRGTFYRWRRGGGMLPLTKVRLLDALEAIEAERKQ